MPLLIVWVMCVAEYIHQQGYHQQTGASNRRVTSMQTGASNRWITNMDTVARPAAFKKAVSRAVSRQAQRPTAVASQEPQQCRQAPQSLVECPEPIRLWPTYSRSLRIPSWWKVRLRGADALREQIGVFYFCARVFVHFCHCLHAPGQSSVTKVAHLLNSIPSNQDKIGASVNCACVPTTMLFWVWTKICRIMFVYCICLFAGDTECVVVYSERKKGFYTCDKGGVRLFCLHT